MAHRDPYHRIVDIEDRIILDVDGLPLGRRTEQVSDMAVMPFSSYLRLALFVLQIDKPDGFHALIIIRLSYGEFLILLITSASWSMPCPE